MSEALIDYSTHFQDLAGVNDKNLKRIEKRFGVQIFVRNDKVHIRGEDENIENVANLLLQLLDLFGNKQDINNGALKFLIPAFHDDPSIKIKDIFSEKIQLITGKTQVTPRSVMQKEYVFAMSKFDIVLAIGPAGTGKTYLAMASAVSDLLRKRVNRIILTRPAVEAGERLGFLPGDLNDKINPYLRPLHDALFDMLETDRVNAMIEQGLIEIAPLAYMRGRTLNDAFIILDEAQNATPDQMKMFLTRLGMNSKAVITGDITQIDLPSSIVSGLVRVKSVLKDIPGIRFVNFTDKDVVRHDLVKQILKAYERDESKREMVEKE
ncbi:Phosphate starvation-inducible protein PhoH, predicted ATPase [hydrothermal vent metagenome]|uniref:PhoH-like protein n=1 Tax=hydrothermal vent metagenome TaxID=652676 RepID=A0A3B1BUI7_9ZZZZ